MGTKNALNISVERESTATRREFPVSSPGIIPSMMMAAPSSDFTLAAATGVQSVFPSTCDTITLAASTTYYFTGTYILNTGATTHTTAMAFGGTATFQTNGFQYTALLWSAAANTITTTQSTTHVSGVASKVLNATSTAVYTIIKFEGIIRTNAGGTLIPQINFSANPTGTNLTKLGSFMQFIPLGTHTFETSGNIA